MFFKCVVFMGCKPGVIYLNRGIYKYFYNKKKFSAMELWIIFIAGFLAAFVGSMSGGGAGFISFYPLLFFGLPLNAAIATNKFGDIGFFPPSIRNFANKKLIRKSIFLPLIIIESVGVIIGTFLIINLTEAMIKYIVTIIITPVFFLMVFENNKIKSGKEHFMWKPVYFFASLYSGILQVGSGFIKMFSLMNLRRISALQSAANSFMGSFPLAILSAGILFYAGLVDIQIGIVLLGGNLLGAHFGSKIAIKKGNTFVRYMLLALMVITLATIWIR